MEYINEEDSFSNEVSISNSSDMFKFSQPVVIETDPFKIEGEELKKVSGLSPAFRRKVARDLQKRFAGIDGTATQQNLLQQAVTGYAMFDLVQPIYNLEYLSKIYEISPYNYAAINAKVANIVGLGYQFVESKKAMEALDNIDNEDQLNRARRKIDRVRQQLDIWLEDVNEEETFVETLIGFLSCLLSVDSALLFLCTAERICSGVIFAALEAGTHFGYLPDFASARPHGSNPPPFFGLEISTHFSLNHCVRLF